MNFRLAQLFLFSCVWLLGTPYVSYSADVITGTEYVNKLVKPEFKKDHKLPPLTRFGWKLPFELRVALAKDWGYALEFGGYVTEKVIQRLENSKSIESRIIQLVKDDPETFKLSVICNRDLPFKTAPKEAWTRNVKGQILSAKAMSIDGNVWQEGTDAVWSPEAPDSVWQAVGKFRADPIEVIRKQVPIAVVLNAGEYGVGVTGFGKKAWEQDPVVMKAKGDKEWYEYISQRKAHSEKIIRDAVMKNMNDEALYVFYIASGGKMRNKNKQDKIWSWDYKHMRQASTLASGEYYYKHFNSGWTGNSDLLTQALNSKGVEISYGDKTSYDWVTSGWPKYHGKPVKDGIASNDSYEGFLKCLYISGTIGANAGFYSFPEGGFKAKFSPNNPPNWLEQMLVLARVHALFSHHDELLLKGDLLPGPIKHAWSKEQPAYEFPSDQKNVRILARKYKDEILVVAWDAEGGNRQVSVKINGKVLKLKASSKGELYLIKGNKNPEYLIGSTGV